MGINAAMMFHYRSPRTMSRPCTSTLHPKPHIHSLSPSHALLLVQCNAHTASSNGWCIYFIRISVPHASQNCTFFSTTCTEWSSFCNSLHTLHPYFLSFSPLTCIGYPKNTTQPSHVTYVQG